MKLYRTKKIKRLTKGIGSKAMINAIYGGHISGRRLRGIKINPIYHENDAANLLNVSGQGKDGQFPPESVEPVGEIQFEVYESIPVPASRLRRQDRCQHHDQDDYDSDEAEEWQDGDEQVTGHYTTQKMPNRKQYLRRQERMNAVSSLDEDPPDFLDPTLDQFTPRTSGYSSPSTSSRPSPKTDRACDNKNSSNSSGYFTPLSLHRQRQLTAVQEQSILAEEEDEEDQEDSGNLSSEDIYEEGLSTDKRDFHKSSHNSSDSLEIGEETCHIVTFTDGKCGKNDELFAGQDSNQNIINNFISYKSELIIEKDIASSFTIDEKNDNTTWNSDKSVRCLDKIAMLPLYSNIHHTSPVTSVDYINNNYGAVPDRMLKHNGPLKEVDQYFEFLHKHTRSLSESEEESTMNKTNSNHETIQYFDSNEHNIKKPSNSLKTLDSVVLKEECDCNGRPTLKCACGRAALQKLLYDKRMVKRYDAGYPLDSSIVKWSPEENHDDKKKKNNNEEVDNKENVRPFVPTYTELKSILICRHETDEPNVNKHIKSKRVTFHEDTVFNEGKKSTYIKEGVTPGFLCALIDSLDEDGFDNPVFEDDENDIKETTFTVETEESHSPLTDDEKLQKKFANKDQSAKTRILSPSSLALKIEDLNACSYMQNYLKGVHGQRCDVIRPVTSCESSPSKLHRAPPVSIEAIAGTIVADASFDEIKEAGEDQFEYYRHRQRRKHLSRYGGEDVGVDEWLKKTKRIKKIKISLIAAAVITVVVVAIALIVHFVGTPDTSATDPTDSVVFEDEIDRDISRFSAGVLFRRR